MSDEELIERIIRTNDSYLFSQLYDRYVRVVYNKCLGFSKSKEEAQDLTHDIFLKLFVKLRSFKGKSKFSTWLYSFTYNHCVNYVQRDSEKRKPKVPIDNYLEKFTEEEIPDDSIFNLKTEKLKKVLELIDVNDKVILLLKYQDDMSIKEIQAILEIGESAVKMRIKRAKERVLLTYNNLK
ncbi:MAG: RNA polymerase subunit sigma-70 [Lutibacter sp.]|nr:MAG: RNA polymerase subunit sigma-70 [Lutibacter sp.]